MLVNEVRLSCIGYERYASRQNIHGNGYIRPGGYTSRPIACRYASWRAIKSIQVNQSVG